MAGYIARNLFEKVLQSLKDYPVVALLGPRQVGKSTLAKKIIQNHPDALYLDLERPSELRKLQDAEYFFGAKQIFSGLPRRNPTIARSFSSDKKSGR